MTDKQVEQKVDNLVEFVSSFSRDSGGASKMGFYSVVDSFKEDYKKEIKQAKNKALDEVLADVENIIKEEYLEKSGLARFKWLKTKIEKLKGIYE